MADSGAVVARLSGNGSESIMVMEMADYKQRDGEGRRRYEKEERRATEI